ncbi:MAG: long-chain fatty acid--CoA ligase [Deltaproteobacteria bacterium]|nr:long-chain fatty acid--CoA ligase [Deltaproteobacteria bacterium]
MLQMSRISFDWLERRNQLSPRKEALRDLHTGRRYTYCELNERANRLANGFRQQWGVRKGDRVSILAHNCTEYLEALFAVAKLGAILVPVNIRLVGPELSYIFNDCEPKGMILGEDFLNVISEIRNDIKISNYLLLDDAYADDMFPYERFLDEADIQKPQLEEEISLDDPHVILYTSGTTGYPKGAIQTHSKILFNSVNANIGLDIVSTDVNLCALPLFHTGGLHVMTTPTLHAGGTVVIMRAFDPGEALKVIHNKDINTVFFVATQWLFMYQHEDFESTDFSGLRLAWTGGAPCPLNVLQAYQEKGVPFRQGYGLTEVGPDAMILPAEDALRKVGSIGLPPFHAAMRVVDINDQDVLPGEVGELIFRGPTVTPGYWNKPEATSEALKNGWFHTGDLAYMDEEGYVFLVDRKKDMYVSGGENVYPAEVEKTLYQYPKIAEIAIFGIPHEKWGEVGHAVVVAKPGETITEEEVITFLKGKLAKYKIPKSVSFKDQLPRTPAGKVLKRTLREPYWEGEEK